MKTINKTFKNSVFFVIIFILSICYQTESKAKSPCLRAITLLLPNFQTNNKVLTCLNDDPQFLNALTEICYYDKDQSGSSLHLPKQTYVRFVDMNLKIDQAYKDSREDNGIFTNYSNQNRYNRLSMSQARSGSHQAIFKKNVQLIINAHNKCDYNNKKKFIIKQVLK